MMEKKLDQGFSSIFSVAHNLPQNECGTRRYWLQIGYVGKLSTILHIIPQRGSISDYGSSKLDWQNDCLKTFPNKHDDRISKFEKKNSVYISIDVLKKLFQVLNFSHLRKEHYLCLCRFQDQFSEAIIVFRGENVVCRI